jgi:predicted nucleotidyltransferase
MPLAPLVADRREEILRLAEKHGAYNVRVFGSAARGELAPESDVDFLVDLEAGRSLFDLGGCSWTYKTCSGARWTWPLRKAFTGTFASV